MNSFSEFWPFYVMEHSRPLTRLLHALGTLASLGLLVWLVARGRWAWLPLVLVVGYGAAWAGHFFVEHNRPATFKYPLWSFAADYKMLWMMLTGRMSREVERARRVRAAAQ